MSAPAIDPATIVCDLVIDGQRVQWIGAEALRREVAEKARQAHKEAALQTRIAGVSA